MPDGESESATQLAQAGTLERNTTCQIEGVDDTWEIRELDYGEELAEAIETVRADHDETAIVDSDSPWVLKVYWNENTDSVWVSTFGYHGGFSVNDGDTEGSDP
jgi:hypothetical protein